MARREINRYHLANAIGNMKQLEKEKQGARSPCKTQISKEIEKQREA